MPIPEETWDMVMMKEVIEELALMFAASVRCKVCPFKESCKAQGKWFEPGGERHLIGCNDFVTKTAKKNVQERLTGETPE
jgi:hypothetical protein